MPRGEFMHRYWYGSTAHTGMRTGFSQRPRLRISTADAATPVLCLAGGPPESGMVHQLVPEEVEASEASAAASGAASGTEARL
jgi:hypothetical protein